MIGTLLKLECKQILKSLIYYLYVFLFVLFITGQLGDSDWTETLNKPEIGQDSYGLGYTDDENTIMEQTINNLLICIENNSFDTYPIGFYKEVKLSDNELDKLKDILLVCTGKQFEEIELEIENYINNARENENSGEELMSLVIGAKEGLTYTQFQEEMRKACKIIGRGSDFEKEKYKSVRTALTYEEALVEYNNLCKKDRVTNAYMRLYSDYAGIVLAVLPIFLGVSRCLRDKKSKLNGVIYSKAASSKCIILSRYISCVIMAFLPVVITAFILQMPYQYYAVKSGFNPDYFAFIKYSFVWLLPEIMFCIALAFLITEFTENIFAIFIQVLLALISLCSASSLIGCFGFHLVTRWNALGMWAQFNNERQNLYINKLFYTIAAIVCIMLTILVYEKKRCREVSLYGKICNTHR